MSAGTNHTIVNNGKHVWSVLDLTNMLLITTFHHWKVEARGPSPHGSTADVTCTWMWLNLSLLQGKANDQYPPLFRFCFAFASSLLHNHHRNTRHLLLSRRHCNLFTPFHFNRPSASTMAGRSRILPILGLTGAVGAGYYLYQAGGDPKVAEKKFESTHLRRTDIQTMH